MTTLQCELCGGKLMGKPGGIFECDSCGMEYSSEWAKAKIQEIKGKVKIEGTVQVAGTVKVDGSANIENLLKRGYIALEDGVWSEAKRHFDEALNFNAECAAAYLGKLCARRNAHSVDDLIDNVPEMIEEDADFQKAIRFGNQQEMDALLDRIQIAAKEKAEFERQLHEELQQQREQNRLRHQQHLAAVQKKNALAQHMIAAAWKHTVGVNADGVVMAVGEDRKKKCQVYGWESIAAVAVGSEHTVGLRLDGTVTATGNNDCGQCEVSHMRNVAAIAAGERHTVCLKKDGTLSAVGNNEHGQCNISNWRDIIAIEAGCFHTVGLKADGTVVAVGNNEYGQCNVDEWTDILSIARGAWSTIGVKRDGTVMLVGDSNECYMRGDWKYWSNIVAVSKGAFCMAGLKADGTVVLDTKSNEYQAVSDWKNIVAVMAPFDNIIGLRSDGTLVAIDNNIKINRYGQSDVSRWKLFKSIETLERERDEARIKLINKLEQEKRSLIAELSALKGLFSGRRRKEIEVRLEAIDHELNGLQ